MALVPQMRMQDFYGDRCSIRADAGEDAAKFTRFSEQSVIIYRPRTFFETQCCHRRLHHPSFSARFAALLNFLMVRSRLSLEMWSMNNTP